tara:strand:- start:294 stop:1208 length:915 start_codon:yes stop_codon:yes gene_type:complete
MKINKSFMKKLLIIILSVFVLVPIVLMLFGYDKTISEGFYTPSAEADLTDKTGAGKMNYVGIGNGIRNSYGIPHNSGSKVYCIFGDISCQTGTAKETGETDSYGNKKIICEKNDGSEVHQAAKCINSIFDSQNSYTFYKLDSSNCIDTDSSSTTLNSLGSLYSLKRAMDAGGDYTNFSIPMKDTDKAPFDISGSSSYLTMKFGDGTDISYSTCFLFDTSSNCAKEAGCGLPSDETEESDEPEPASENELKTKCLGDFGDKAGDKLCCGQDGTIEGRYAKYTCPESHQYCRNYKCGESWGTCFKE